MKEVTLILAIVILVAGCDQKQKTEAAAIVTSAVSNLSLDREQARRLIASNINNAVGTYVDLSSVEICSSQEDSWKKLEVIGLINLDLSKTTPEASGPASYESCNWYAVTVTDKGRKYIGPKSPKGTFISSAIFGDVQVTGLLSGKNSNGINTATVEYSIKSTLTPFSTIYSSFLPSDSTYKAKADLVLYDDGWRVTSNQVFNDQGEPWPLDITIKK